MSGIPGKQDFAGREARLSNEVIITLDNIRRTSRAAYDELAGQLQAARYTDVPAKIRKMRVAQLESLLSLVAGYQSRMQADNQPVVINTTRPRAATPLTVPQPFTMQRPDGAVQVCITGVTGGAQVARTFHPGNTSGIPSDTETLLAAAPADPLRLCKQNDRQLIYRNANFNVEDDIFRVSLDTNGDFTAPEVIATLVPTNATHTNNAKVMDFSDGRNYWAVEYDATSNTATIHKVNLRNGTVTTQALTNIDLDHATVAGFLTAVGDVALLIGGNAAGDGTRALAFELADGATPGAINFTTAGATIVTGAPATRLLGGFGTLVHTADGIRYRGFFMPAADTAGHGVHVIDFDPTKILDGGPMTDIIDRVQTIFGRNTGWPIAAFLENWAVSPDNKRLLMRGAAANDYHRFAIDRPREIVAQVAVDLAGTLSFVHATNSLVQVVAANNVLHEITV